MAVRGEILWRICCSRVRRFRRGTPAKALSAPKQLHMVCSQDPNCADGVDPLLFSVDDHLLYYGITMGEYGC